MNIDAAKAAHESLLKSGINFVACLPDSMTVSGSAWVPGWAE